MFVVGDRIVDPATRRISRGSETTRLSPKAMHVLTTLRDAGGGVLSRAELMDEVWAGVTVGEEVLTHAIAEIRRAIGDSARQPRFLETVHKTGYRLMADRLEPPASTDAFDLDHHAAYLDGCELFFQAGLDNVRQAADLFEAIQAASPSHALAHAGLAKARFCLELYYGHAGDGGVSPVMCGQRAVALDGASPDAHAALGFALAMAGDHGGAWSSFSRSVKLNANLAEPHYLLGRACLTSGDHRMAAPMLERAAALRLDDYHSLILGAKARRSAGDEARFRANLIRARRRIDAVLELDPNARRALCDRIYCMIESGEIVAGVEGANRLMEDPCSTDYYLVGALVRAGELGLAIDCFDAVRTAGWSHGAWLAHDRDIDPLRHERRFRGLTTDLRMP